ncbi:MAG TPA: M1 family aminopeptidase [Nocardioides sp.]|nr:M1 family aminopeptidase [Nocardioides sp.]
MTRSTLGPTSALVAATLTAALALTTVPAGAATSRTLRAAHRSAAPGETRATRAARDLVASSSRWDAALSRPRRDDFYPSHGSRVVDALHYGLDLTWHRSTRRLVGHETVVLRAAHSARRFSLELEHGLDVRRARLDGRPVHVSHVGHRVRFRAPLTAGTRHVVTIGYAGHPHPVAAPTRRGDFSTVGLTTTGNGSIWTMQEPFGAYTWYAVDDQPADKAFYDFRISAPGSWVGIANGALLRRYHRHGRTITRFHLGVPSASYLTTLAVGAYRHTVLHALPHLPIHLWTEKGKAWELHRMRFVPKAVRFLQHQVGRYPFGTLGMVAVPSNSAMETETIPTMGDNKFVLTQDNIVHELAHQWYGDTVTPSDWSDVWMNEGMALYLAEGRWQSQHFGFALRKELHSWAQQAPSWRREWGAPAAYDRRDFAEINVYAIPALMWDMLRERVGHHRFDRLIAQWPADRRHASSSRADLAAWWSRHTGQDLGHFFHKWLLAKREPSWHRGGSARPMLGDGVRPWFTRPGNLPR